MIKRIFLHLTAFVAVVPVMAVFSEGSVWVNAIGMVYFVCLGIWLNDSPRGRKFLRDYCNEVHRIERMLTNE